MLMGYLSDLQTVMNAVSSAKAGANGGTHKSIAKGALEGTMQFPCLISDSIPIDMASTVARTFERVYASFVQTYLSTNNTIDISVDKNASSYLKKFHSNIKLESTAEDLYYEHCVDNTDEEYSKLMERIYNGTTTAFINESENKMIVFNFSDKFNKAIYDANKDALENYLESVDFTPFPKVGNSPFFEAPGDGPVPVSKTVTDLTSNMINKSVGKVIDNAFELDKEKKKIDYQDLYHKQNQAIKARDDIRKDLISKMAGGTGTPQILKDSDVKKTNDLQPYIMQVRLMAVNSNKEFVQFMDFNVGVKVILHPIKSDEMIVNIQHTLQNNGILFNFIRWTTGEKSLFKDLILRINDTKLDAANKSRGASPWWGTLKRIKETSKVQSAFFSRTQFVPQSTIVLSAFEADSIEKTYGYNLRNYKFAQKLMSSLFLMNFVILDEGSGTIDVLYDGETTFQTYALETLEREVSMNSNKLGKELTRMISR